MIFLCYFWRSYYRVRSLHYAGTDVSSSWINAMSNNEGFQCKVVEEINYWPSNVLSRLSRNWRPLFLTKFEGIVVLIFVYYFSLKFIDGATAGC